MGGAAIAWKAQSANRAKIKGLRMRPRLPQPGVDQPCRMGYLERMNFDLYDYTILLTRAGSRVYGVHTPESDLDVKGVCIPPASFFLGLDRFEQADSPDHFRDARFQELLTSEEREVCKRDPLEGSIYDIRKMLSMLLDANPNSLDLLFCRACDVLMSSSLGEELRANRHLVLSRNIKHRFTGYAFGQLERIKLHKRYLLKPPTHKPTRAEFGLAEQPDIPKDQLAAVEHLIEKTVNSWNNFNLQDVESEAVRDSMLASFRDALRHVVTGLKLSQDDEETAKWRAAARLVGLDDNLLQLVEKERSYKTAVREYKSYQEWLAKRNPERAALEARHGYDTKHGMHLVRLMRMCREILETGQVHVYRGDIDADELRAIRNGAWSYEQLLEYAENEDRDLSALYKSDRCPLPHSPDRAAINALATSLVTRGLGLNRWS